MIEDREAPPQGRIYEPYLDIPPNWNDIRTKFGYTTLGKIASPKIRMKSMNDKIKEKQKIGSATLRRKIKDFISSALTGRLTGGYTVRSFQSLTQIFLTEKLRISTIR